MSDPLDLDAIEARAMTGYGLDKWWLIPNDVMALVAELRTAWDEIDRLQRAVRVRDDEQTCGECVTVHDVLTFHLSRSDYAHKQADMIVDLLAEHGYAIVPDPAYWDGEG
jgi:hypothetical protein